MFEKNLDKISNIALKRRLARISNIESRSGISYCITPSNDYVLLKNELPCDDLNNPREAIRKNFEANIRHEMKSNDIIINFGIGLGYLLDETYNRYPSRIYIYEPDLYLLHFVLNNVDISDHLASGRVFITNDMDELINKVSDTFITKDKVEIVYLQNYAIIKHKELLMLTQRVLDTCKSKMIDVSTITQFSKMWLTNTISNLAEIRGKKVYKLSDLEGKYFGKTALIVAAGPSLKDNIENIKKNRENLVIFAVNKIVSYLIQNEIIPDYVVCLDACNMEKTITASPNIIEQMNCIMDIRTDYTLIKRNFKNIFINFSETDFLMKKLSKFNSDIEFYESGGSAATFALTIAVKLGFAKIILSGLDLAFKDGATYATGENLNRISQNEIIIDNVKKDLVQVKSVSGDMVYTRADYQAFIHHFELLLHDLKHYHVYNTSSFGASIQGMKNKLFEDIEISPQSKVTISNLEPLNLALGDFMDEEFLNINNIISILSKEEFSPALISSIVKSAMIYQYMQNDILNVLQKNFDTNLASEFISNTKQAIKTVVELLQKNKLI